MTLEQADKIADVILSAPEVYGSPPTMFPLATSFESGKYWSEGTVRNSAWLIGLPDLSDTPFARGVYSCRYGFRESYSSIISTWGYTDFGTGKWSGRYVTLDDIKMMAYVGIENYRAKILGHRWRFNEKGINTVNDTYAYRRGSIVRQDDGKRWVKCRDNNVTPIPGVTIDGWVGSKGTGTALDPIRWVPMTRRQAFKKPLVESVPLLDGVSVPLDKVTRFIKAATIVGQNDLVQLRNVWDYSSLGETISNVLNWEQLYPLNGEGRMVVYISEEDGLEKASDESVVAEKSIVWGTSNTLPIYEAWYKNPSGETISWSSFSPIHGAELQGQVGGMVTRHACAFRSSFIPLAEGRPYYVYIKREESRAGCWRRSDFPEDGYASGKLVVFRVKTDPLARRF